MRWFWSGGRYPASANQHQPSSSPEAVGAYGWHEDSSGGAQRYDEPTRAVSPSAVAAPPKLAAEHTRPATAQTASHESPASLARTCGGYT
jgi:hypothetical protein